MGNRMNFHIVTKVYIVGAIYFSSTHNSSKRPLGQKNIKVTIFKILYMSKEDDADLFFKTTIKTTQGRKERNCVAPMSKYEILITLFYEVWYLIWLI
jgi:hypothetical protein